jgi:hypothetical protein
LGIPQQKAPKSHAKHIPPASPPQRSEVVFCFRHIDWTNTKFQLTGKGNEYLGAFLDKMKLLCTMRVTEMLSGGKSTRCHVIDFDDTTEPNGFSKLPEQLRDLRAIQFMIAKNEHGRVHGFVIGNVFHVVWFDPEHNLYGGNAG